MAIDVEKLKRIAGYLASDHEGEAATAARMATAMLKEAGLTWHDIVARAFANEPDAETQGEVWRGFGQRQRSYAARQAPERFKVYNGLKVSDVVFAVNNWPNGLERASSWERSFWTNVSKPYQCKSGWTEKQWEAVLGLCSTLGITTRRSA